MNDGRFPAWPKTQRLSKSVAITEKIDGTNGLISIRPVPYGTGDVGTNAYRETSDGRIYVIDFDSPLTADGLPSQELEIRAGSRKRWLSASADNFGFWQWVSRNAVGLSKLGVGDHYGEWYGKGIQRGYGLSEKRFALFNVGRWFEPRDGGQWSEPSDDMPLGNPYPYPNAKLIPNVEQLTVVPLLAVIPGTDVTPVTDVVIKSMEARGSYVTGDDWERSYFERPEGVCIFWEATYTYMKHFTKWESK